MILWYQLHTDSTYTKEELLYFLEREEHGIVILEGYSGCGKTSLLKELQKQCSKKVFLTPYESFLQDSLFSVRTSTSEKSYRSCFIPDDCIYAIEDIDFLHGRFHAQTYLGSVLNERANHSLIILTGIRINNRIPELYRSLSNPQVFLAVYVED